jgi:hypothetical protein
LPLFFTNTKLAKISENVRGFTLTFWLIVKIFYRHKFKGLAFTFSKIEKVAQKGRKVGGIAILFCQFSLFSKIKKWTKI